MFIPRTRSNLKGSKSKLNLEVERRQLGVRSNSQAGKGERWVEDSTPKKFFDWMDETRTEAEAVAKDPRRIRLP